MADAQAEPDIRLVLRPLPNAVPAAVRLRRALKMLLRGFGFRVVRIEDAPRGAEGQAQADPLRAPGSRRAFSTVLPPA
jgi:hypothetical protein